MKIQKHNISFQKPFLFITSSDFALLRHHPTKFLVLKEF